MKMTDNELKLVRSALLAVEESEVRAFRKFPAVDTPHSEEYLVNMSELIDRTEHPVRRLSRRKVVAIAIAAAVLVLLTLTTAAFGERIANFFEERFDDHTRLGVSNTETGLLEKIYLPTYIPEGFEQIKYSVGLIRIDVYWEKDGAQICYSQNVLAVGAITMDTENADYTTVTLNGTSMRRVIKNDTYLLVWEDGKYCYIMQCPVSLGWEEIEKIVLSIAEQ